MNRKENRSSVGMNRRSGPESAQPGIAVLWARGFPVTALVAVVTAVCLGLALSAAYSFLSLSRLRTQYMQNRAREVAAAVDAQARGPGRRNNPAYWQDAIGEGLARFGDSVAFFTLVGPQGQVLASSGGSQDAVATVPEGFGTYGGERMFVAQIPLSTPRQVSSGLSSQIAGWRMRIGLKAEIADFIRRQAIIQLAVAGIAIVTLGLLARYLLVTLARFVELEAREESERHLRVLGSMAASLAHEIRNPLGAMKGLTQLAQEDLPPDHRTQELMKTVVTEAERLEKLVSDLLSFARPRKPQISDFDLHQLVTEVRDLLQLQAEERRVSVSVEPSAGSLRISSDHDSLRQVLLNVVLNALDASPEAAKVTLAVRRDAASSRALIEVSDAGPGLQGRDPEELFQPFVTTKAQGTGLGLAVSRRIVASLGGAISLADKEGGGARCTIRLPLVSKIG